MNESIHEYVLQELSACKGRWRHVALQTEVTIGTLKRIASRETPDPGVTKIERMANYFRMQHFVRGQLQQERRWWPDLARRLSIPVKDLEQIANNPKHVASAKHLRKLEQYLRVAPRS